MAFFGFVQYQFGSEPKFWKAAFENLLLKKQSLRNKFKLQLQLLRHVQNQRIKPRNIFVTETFIIVVGNYYLSKSSKDKISNCWEQNWKLKTLFFWSFQIQVQNWYWKTPKTEKLNFWFTLTGPIWMPAFPAEQVQSRLGQEI